MRCGERESSASLRGERAGRVGTRRNSSKNGPPLPGPLLPPREERENLCFVRPRWRRLSSLRVHGTFQFRGHSPFSRTGDWKVPRTRRQECLRYGPTPVHGGRVSEGRVRGRDVWHIV